jgi:hypothetical protein
MHCPWRSGEKVCEQQIIDTVENRMPVPSLKKTINQSGSEARLGDAGTGVLDNRNKNGAVEAHTSAARSAIKDIVIRGRFQVSRA